MEGTVTLQPTPLRGVLLDAFGVVQPHRLQPMPLWGEPLSGAVVTYFASQLQPPAPYGADPVTCLSLKPV